MTLTPSQMARMKIGVEKKEPTKPVDDSVTMPMFVPSQMRPGDGILQVTTRQNFVNEGIGIWIDWHLKRVLGIMFAVAALFLLSIHLWLATAAGLLAGYFYSDHLRVARRISLFYKTRRVLYTR